MNTKMITKIGVLAVAVCIMLVFAIGCKKKDQGSAMENAVSSAAVKPCPAKPCCAKDPNAMTKACAAKDPNAMVGACVAKDSNAVAAIKEALPEQTTCPVMGGKINKDIFVEYKGQKIYFCCTACVETFKKDPEKYIGKIK